MKNVIEYTCNNGSIADFKASGNNLDAAYRSVKNESGRFILTAKGRLTESQFATKCNRYGIYVDTIDGKPIFNDSTLLNKYARRNGQSQDWFTKGEEVKPIEETKPTKPQRASKFMHARFPSKCNETGLPILKGELIFFDGKAGKAYKQISNAFVAALDNEDVLMRDLVPKVDDKPIEIKVEVVEPIEEVKPIETKPTIDVTELVTESESQTSGGDAGKVLWNMIKPHAGSIDIDYAKVESAIEAAVQKYTRRVEITLTIDDKPIVIKLDNQHKQFPRLMAYCANRKNILLVGPAGTGKTYAAEVIAKELDLDYSSISVNNATQKHEFFGYMDANGNYVRTPFRDRFEYGGTFLLDELDSGNANSLTAINMASANGSATFPDGHVVKHKDFVLIASANTYGLGANYEYVGRNKLDAATRNRFAKIFWDYDEVMELALSPNARWTQYCQAIRKAVADLKIKDVIISIRQMIDGGDMLKCLDRADVEEDYLWNEMKASDVAKIKERVTY